MVPKGGILKNFAAMEFGGMNWGYDASRPIAVIVANEVVRKLDGDAGRARFAAAALNL